MGYYSDLLGKMHKMEEELLKSTHRLVIMNQQIILEHEDKTSKYYSESNNIEKGRLWQQLMLLQNQSEEILEELDEIDNTLQEMQVMRQKVYDQLEREWYGLISILYWGMKQKRLINKYS